MTKATIEYCVKCKWHLRATWYLQELTQTFNTDQVLLEEISLRPSLVPGTFRVLIDDDQVIWDRKVDDGFPDSKALKQRVKAVVQPDASLGHIDKPNKNGGLLVCKECVRADQTQPE